MALMLQQGAAPGTPGGALSVTATPPYLSSGTLHGDSHTTAATTAIVSGGSGSFTYAWTIIDEDGFHTFVANSPGAATTTFTIGGISDGDFCTATGRCTVTDTVGGATGFVDVPIQHERFGTFS